MSGAESKAPWSSLAAPVGAMAVVVLASNILVQYPFDPLGLSEYLTWGAFSYPFAFLITDLTNRRFGASNTRRIVYIGFIFAVVLSAVFAGARIAIASGSAFLLSQLLDVAIFDRLRGRAWWMPPFLSSLISSALDTVIFFTLAFSCHPLLMEGLGAIGVRDACDAIFPWPTLGLCDYLVKLALAVLFILPYRFLLVFVAVPRGTDMQAGAR